MRKVLIIDEDAISLYIAEKLFKSAFPQYEVSVVADESNALNALSNGHFTPDQLPDIIILDHYDNKPGEWLFLDGLIGLLPDYSKFVSVHIISAFLYQVEQSRLMAYEFINSFHIKPLTKELLTAVNNAHDTAKATSLVYPVKN